MHEPAGRAGAGVALAHRSHLTLISPIAYGGHMTSHIIPSDEALTWFFTDPASRYTLKEVVELTRCSKDDIQNWVKRGMIKPDEVSGGNRIYSPVTVATLAIADDLRLQGVSANHALVQATIVTKIAFQWFAGEEIPDGTIPDFKRDFRQHYAVLATYEDERSRGRPTEPGVELLRGVLRVNIVHRTEIDPWLDCPAICIVRLHWTWLNLAWTAHTIKERSARSAKGED
ncbi:MAG: helix-turn-helix domain-containing protein [Amaricoccus sp.]|uniref:helix-turn-helix domain-containing protein n=1 Tax=Amaricoccus sp. TaxID=1872485 RepID=UPI0039E4BF00